MKCLIYTRVSTDRQSERGPSLPAQLSACRSYAQQHRCEILEEFTEAGASARTADRPEHRRLLKRCRRKADGISVVLVRKIDRSARNVTDDAMIKTLLKRSGIRGISVQEHFEDSISGQLVENILAAIADFYSANLSEEVKKGMKQLVLNGRWPHQPPRGYRFVGTPEGRRVLEIDPVQGPLMQQMFELYATGRWSLRELGREMCRRGMQASQGRPLSTANVRRFLSNPFFIGRILWQGFDVAGVHPPLISAELYQQVQCVLVERYRDPHPGTVVSGFPLRGVGALPVWRANDGGAPRSLRLLPLRAAGVPEGSVPSSILQR